MEKHQKKINNYQLFKVEEKDAERIWEIRNHPLVRENSGNTEIIALENHKIWFRGKYLGNRGNFCYTLKDEKANVVGYCRYDFDRSENAYVISIAIDPENQGKGLGSLLLSESIEKVKNKRKIPVLAEVKKNNIASAKLFEKNGFEKHKEDKNNFYYQKML